MPKNNKKVRQTSLFDIRIKSLDHNVIVLKGPEHDASSALLSGVIVLSVLEPISIKKLTLKLYATLRLNWTEYYQGVKGQVARPMKYEKKIYEFNWDPLNINDYCKNLYENNNSSELPGLSSGTETLNKSNNSSNTSLKSMHKQSKSSVNLSQSFASLANLAHSSSSHDKHDGGQGNHILVQGNYEFPFSTIVPGNIPESIEGLPGCSLVYKLQSTIERGRFSQPLVTKKHMRVVRTTTSDAVELSETIAVDNTWPKKVDYSISAPNRAVAIGSSTRVDMLLVPLLKGLKLGNVRLSLVEYYTYCGHVGGHTDEREVTEKTIKKPKGANGKDIWDEMEIGLDGNFYNDGEIELSPDRWNITTYLQIPPNLSLCTQDCDVLSNVKVRHKLKFIIGLINPDGHVSELRATLPIILFISPFVALTAKKIEPYLDEQHSHNVEDVSVEKDNEGDDVLFSTDPELAAVPGSPVGLAINAGTTDTQDLLAPPNYENRVYDRLWSDIATPLDSPITSGLNTPYNGASDEHTPAGSLPIASSRNPILVPQQSYSLNNSQLVENLRLLHLQREANHQSMDDLTLSSPPHTPSSSVGHASLGNAARRKPKFTLASEENEEPDYFSFKNQSSSGSSLSLLKTVGPSLTTGTLLAQTPGGINNLGALMSPGAQSPVQHLSRSNSHENLDLVLSGGSGSQSPSNWDNQVMSRVPSYSTALKSQTTDDFTPLYEPPLPGSSIDLQLLNKRLLAEEQKAQLLPHSNLKSSKSYIRRTNFNSESNPITFELARSRGSSTNSSPAVSRNQSSSNLFGFNTSNSNSSTKIAKHLSSSGSSSQQQPISSPVSKSPARGSGNNLAGSGSSSTFNLAPMTPIPKVASPQLPQNAHLHNQVSDSGSKSSSNIPKTAVSISSAGSEIKLEKNPSFLNLTKKSHSSMSLNFLHKKK